MTAIRPLFTFNRFPIESRLHIHEHVRAIAQNYTIPLLMGHTDRALAHDRATQQAMAQLASVPEHRYGPGLVTKDNQLDRSITGFDSSLAAQIHIFGPDSERGRAAERVRRTAMPEGSMAIISLPYVHEHQAVNAMLTRLDNPNLADAIELLPELRPMIEHIRTLNQEYGAGLAEYVRDVPSREEVRAADERGNEMLLETVAIIIAHGATSGDTRTRDELLRVVNTRDSALRDLRRRRRRVNAEGAPSSAEDGAGEDAGTEQPGDTAPAGTGEDSQS